MDQVLPANLSGDEGDASSDSNNLHDNEVIPWYFSREEIEINSPSRQDGIDLNKETRLRNSYLRFFSKLGVKLKVPKITTATAIVYCHRFFLRQSHAKNDRWTISTACMFLAGKVEESHRFLKEVIIASYEILHNKELTSAERKEVYQQQKELVKTAELLVLSTLNFDLSIGHPFKPLMDAIQKYKVEEAKTQFPRVAICLVSDSYKTTLCLQYKPHKIAAGAFFLAAELLKMDLQTYGEGLWQDFDVTLTSSQLEDIRGQMRELYEKKDTPSQGSTVKGGEVQQPISRDMASTEKCSTSDIEGGSSKANLEMIIQSTGGIDLNEFGKDNSESEAGENQGARKEKEIDGSESSD